MVYKIMDSKKLLIFSLTLNILSILFGTFLVIKYSDKIYKLIPKTISNKLTTTKIVVLGDSRVEWGDWTKGLGRNDVKNCGIGGITTYRYLGKLDSLIFKNDPQICIIQIGINDIRTNINIDTTEKHFEQLIDSLLRHKIKPIVTSIIPLRKDFCQDEPNETIVNNRTDSLNYKLMQLCSMKNIAYLDINQNITENNRLKVVFTQDGIHLNESGYLMIFKQINEYLKRINE